MRPCPNLEKEGVRMSCMTKEKEVVPKSRDKTWLGRYRLGSLDQLELIILRITLLKRYLVHTQLHPLLPPLCLCSLIK
jgi:hypothetical protein